MNFTELKTLINNLSKTESFQAACNEIQNIIFSLKKSEFIPLITEIGAIPEDIMHDSSEEKLYAKVSDIVLAKCFIELGLNAIVLRERTNCADVLVKSKYHNYSLVGDAKSFRLSRTAKNQKDFKVDSMVHWKCDNDYSVLCCPYFQYPKTQSAIYGQALNGNVSLFSWEYFHILLKEDIIETPDINLDKLWTFSAKTSQTTHVSDMNRCFLPKQNAFIREFFNFSEEKFKNEFEHFKTNIISRGITEINYWENEIMHIKNLSREQAINLLIKSLKLNEKINSINNYLNQLRSRNEN